MLISTPYSNVDGEQFSWGWHVIMLIWDNAWWCSKFLSIVSDIPGRTHKFINSGSPSGSSVATVVKGLGRLVIGIGLHILNAISMIKTW